MRGKIRLKWMEKTKDSKDWLKLFLGLSLWSWEFVIREEGKRRSIWWSLKM